MSYIVKILFVLLFGIGISIVATAFYIFWIIILLHFMNRNITDEINDWFI